MGIVITNGKVYHEGAFTNKDILIENEKITKIATTINHENHQIIDAQNQIVVPGLVDVHVHLREPGGEHKETIATGTEAAARGGFTTISPMPNTNPVPDNEATMNDLQTKIKNTAKVRVLPYAAITKNQKGEELNDFSALKGAGAFAFTDDGVGVQSAGMMLEAMKQAAKINKAVIAHCEDNTLINNGSVHEGKFSAEQGINGIPNVCEAVHIARDVLLAEAAGCHYHVCHVSTKESVRAIRDAKRAGIKVTAEVTPHHLLLTEDDIPGLDTNYKMNPPLRSAEDRDALIEGLLDGTLDIIASDHAPHAEAEKAQPIDKAPFGIVGLETAFPLLYTHLVKKNVLTLEELVERLTKRPSDVFNLSYGELQEGGLADITIIDLEKEQSIDPEKFASKGRNTPFANWNCAGWPTTTIVDGKIVWEKERVGQ